MGIVSVPIAQESGHDDNQRIVLFGPRLKEQREKRGITLEQISKSTKIGVRFLEALEEDQFERLPGGIFNKGFVRAYARCVGLDEEQAIADYLAVTEANQPAAVSVEEAPVLEPPPQPKRERAASLPWGIFATVLLIVAFSFAVWGFFFRATSTREKEVSLPIQRQPPAPATVPVAAPSLPSTQPNSPKPSSNAQTPSVPPASTQPATPASSAATPPGNSTAVPVWRDIVLKIKANEEAWLSITVDGEVTSELTLPASGEKIVHAKDQIVVKTGNVGALDFELKGKPVPVLGELGEVKTLAFDAAGWHTVPKVPSPPESKPEQ